MSWHNFIEPIGSTIGLSSPEQLLQILRHLFRLKIDQPPRLNASGPLLAARDNVRAGRPRSIVFPVRLVATEVIHHLPRLTILVKRRHRFSAPVLGLIGIGDEKSQMPKRDFR